MEEYKGWVEVRQKAVIEGLLEKVGFGWAHGRQMEFYEVERKRGENAKKRDNEIEDTGDNNDQSLDTAPEWAVINLFSKAIVVEEINPGLFSVEALFLCNMWQDIQSQ